MKNRTCEIAGCERAYEARGMCAMHYKRVRRGGSTQLVVFRPSDWGIEDVIRNYTVGHENTEECWEWQRGKSRGYGTIWWEEKQWLAHRLAYTLYFGEIPDGASIRHRCDNLPCINPHHLEEGTHADNMRDMCERGRHVTRRGEESARATLTESGVIDLRWRRVVNGESLAALGREYGVTREAVLACVKGRTWSHAPFPQSSLAAPRRIDGTF